MGIHLKRANPLALSRGQLAHVGLASLASGESFPAACAATDVLFHDLVAQAQQLDPSNWRLFEEDLLIWLYKVRGALHVLSTTGIIKDIRDGKLQVVAVEQPVASEDGDDAAYGTLDLLVIDAVRNAAWLIDFKSTTLDPMTIIATKSFDGQMLWYRDLAERAIEEHGHDVPLVGYQLVYFQLPTIKYCAKDKGDPANYYNRVQAWYEEKLTKDPSHPPVAHLSVNYPMTEVQKDTETGIRRAALKEAFSTPYLVVDEWPREPDSCVGAWGTLCQYHSLCCHSPHSWPRIIKANYTWRKKPRYRELRPKETTDV
jgi:hypothetical protein